MNSGYEHALQYQLFSCAYPHSKHVMPLACERVITCQVRAFTLLPEIPWRVTFSPKKQPECPLNKRLSRTLYTNKLRQPSWLGFLDLDTFSWDISNFCKVLVTSVICLRTWNVYNRLMIFTVSYGAYLPNAIDRGTAFQFSENQTATPVWKVLSFTCFNVEKKP